MSSAVPNPPDTGLYRATMSCDLFLNTPSCRVLLFPTIYCIQRFEFAFFFSFCSTIYTSRRADLPTLLGESFGPRTPPPRDLHFSVRLNFGSDGSEKIIVLMDLKITPDDV
jgi:hypothetical protein